MYARGQGVVRDDAQAVVWFGRAASLAMPAASTTWAEAARAPASTVCPLMRLNPGIEATNVLNSQQRKATKILEGAYAPLTVKMTREDVAEANQRVARFVAVSASKPR